MMKSQEKQENNRVYFNDPQLDAMYTAANVNVIVGGRRLGKSHGFMAPFSLRNTQSMPRSTGGFVGTTYQQLLTRTLPGTIQALEQWGYKRDVHFFIGRKPPRAANFETPYINPASYDYVVVWYNGTIWRLISQDRPGTSNSLTLDWGGFDEARFLNFEKLKEETFPAMGGYSRHFINNPWYRSKMIISDMPTTKKGSWFLKYQEDMDSDLIETIQALVVEKYRIENRGKQSGWTDSLRRYYREVQRNLSKLRSIAVYYREWSSIENIALLGEKYIRDMKRDLPPLVFLTSIMSKKVTKLKDGFYSNLTENHYYDAFDNSYLDSLDYQFDKLQDECSLQDKDCNHSQPLCIAFDYNANINWLIVGQRQGSRMPTLKSFFVKYERKLREVIQDYCKYYRHHKTKEVVYYYNNTAISSNYAVNDDDFKNVVIDEFKKHKWTIIPVYIGKTVSHKEKHRMINDALNGVGDYLYPTFNKPNNEALLLSMEQTGTRIGSRGFTKDKTGEKLAETEEDKLEHRTDGTDAWDDLFLGMNKYPVKAGSNIGMVSSF